MARKLDYNAEQAREGIVGKARLFGEEYVHALATDNFEIWAHMHEIYVSTRKGKLPSLTSIAMCEDILPR